MRNSFALTLVAAVLLLPAAVYGLDPGDMNCDGIVNYSDIDPFVAALSCTGGDPSCWPGPCPWLNADCNGDSAVTYADIDAFVGLIGTVYAQDVVKVELAGNSLSAYPYFEYVKAFNENAPIKLALDPTRYPDIVGKTADVYVVSENIHVGDALVDSGDGAETVTFGGTTIQANTFTIVGAYELNSAVYQEATGDYTGLGHGYDVVVDMNQNGELDGGDYVDGLSRDAGLYVIHDTTDLGPLAVSTVTSYSVGTIYGIPSGYTNEQLFYPTDIADMEPLPLIVISHGNGHNYQWYGHIGHHMASYGYIVMAHQNNTGPGIEECSVTTLGHTDAMIQFGQAGSIPGAAAIAGKIDTSRIIWIGHSRGAEGVARAYDRIYDSDYTHGAVAPTHYSIDSIILISSMLPVDFLKTTKSNPHDANYHLWTASGDGDVDGSAGCDLCQTYHLHERATRYRMSTTVQGTGHAWFHDGGGTSWFEGPCSIGEDNTHLIELGLFLPLIKHYAEGNVPATDFFWRQYEHFHPIGVDTSNPCIVVTSEYRNGNEEGNTMIDDYQTQPAVDTSSSGGPVSFTVNNLQEGRLDDNNSSFTWSSSDPFNGATQCSSSDDSKGVVFDWNGGSSYYKWTISPPLRDFSDDLYLQFRGAQGTQHPYTLAALTDTTFVVTLEDGSGTTSSINIGAYGGGGLEQPYQRQGGWHNEMEVNRFRLTDFLTNGSGLDLTDIASVKLEFGPSFGSSQGRIVIDELMLTNDYPPFFIPLDITLASVVPEFLPPGTPTTINVEVLPGHDTLVAGSAVLYYRYDGGAFQGVPMTELSEDLYQATLPAPTCSDQPEFYMVAEGAVTGPVYLPAAGASAPYVSFVGTFVSILDDNFQTDKGWTVESDASLTGGEWERATPTTDGTYDEPTADYDGSGKCFVTENKYHADVDYGPTMLISPTLDLSGTTNPVLRYARWWANDDQDDDPFDVEIGIYNTGTATWDWYLVERVMNVEPGWVPQAVYVLDYVPTLTDQMRIRFSVNDTPNNSKDEGAVDAVEVFDVTCP